MKKNSNKTLVELIKDAPCIWVGVTNQQNLHILLWNNASQTHCILIENNDSNVMVKLQKQTGAFYPEVVKLIKEVYPTLKDKDFFKNEIPGVPSGLSLTGDENELLYSKGIKFLSEKAVKQFLQDQGVDITKYNYTNIKVDNSHALKPQPITTSVSNCDPALKPYLFDTSSKKDYFMDPKEEFIMEMLDNNAYTAVIFEGEPGCGKSTLPVIYCASEKKKNKIDIPCVVTECTQNMDEDSIISNFVPNKSGGYDLIWGPLVAAFAYGAICVVNEFNYAPAGVISCLHSMIDDSAHVRLHDGSVIQRHKDFRLVLTCNLGLAGTFDLNDATINRCAYYAFPETTKETIIERVMVETGYKNTKVLEVVANNFDSLRNICKSKDWGTVETYRNVARFLSMILICPNKEYLDTQFDMSFVFHTRKNMNDRDIETKDLQEIRKPFIEEIASALSESTGDTQPDSYTSIEPPAYDPDELIDALDSSFLDIEEEVK